MRSMLQLLGGVAVAGAVAAGTTAFTATGLATNAGASGFVGGTISQTVTGATLSSITYHTDTTPGDSVDSITMVFAATMAGRTVGGTLHYGASSTQTYTCSISTVTATCALSPSVVGLTSNDVTVS
jgi:hypothetical protein